MGVRIRISIRRAVFVLGRIDEILSWEKSKEQEKDVRFVELGEYLCEVRGKQYWRLEHLNSFDEFLEKRFADSRRKAYYLMAIHENLTRIPKHELQKVGWSKATELVKVARRDGEQFDCATWSHRAKEMPKEGFKNEVERHLTGRNLRSVSCLRLPLPAEDIRAAMIRPKPSGSLGNATLRFTNPPHRRVSSAPSRNLLRRPVARSYTLVSIHATLLMADDTGLDCLQSSPARACCHPTLCLFDPRYSARQALRAMSGESTLAQARQPPLGLRESAA